MNETIIGNWIDPTGKSVFLSMEQWVGHILRSHPEMAVRLEDVGKTIANPELIFQDGEEDLYYRKGFSKSGIRYWKVVIRKSGDDYRHYKIITAFRTRKMQEKGILIWRND